MEKSKVFFTDLRTVPGNDLLTKLEKLIRRAGIADIDFDGKFTAIKIHFGEPGNLAYIRPNYAARVVDVIRSLGSSEVTGTLESFLNVSTSCTPASH